MSIPFRWAAGMLPGRPAAVREVDGLFGFAKMAGWPMNPVVESSLKPLAVRA